MGRLIELEVGEIKSVAELMDEKAPVTCNALWDALPLDAIGNHAKFAGEEVFFIFSRYYAPPRVPMENPVMTSLMKPGEIYGWGNMTVVCYGRMANETLPANFIAKVTEDTFNAFRRSFIRCFKEPIKIIVRRKT